MATVVLTQNFPDWTSFDSTGGNTKDNAVLIAVSKERFKYKTGKSDGSASNRDCGFIAIGDG